MLAIFHGEGPALERFEVLRKQKVLKRSRIDRRIKGKNIQKLIIGIGQEHPVHKGKYSSRQAKKIGSVQAWIYVLCDNLHTLLHVKNFGQEGYSEGGAECTNARLSQHFLDRVQQDIRAQKDVHAFFKHVAQEWKRALSAGAEKDIHASALALNALTVLQAEQSDVGVFPIEQNAVHGPIGEGISKLQDLIREAESQPAFRAVQKKNGKQLTQEEYDAALRHSALVKQFNTLLKHPERDRSLFREVVERTQHEDTVVFVLGAAHRVGMIRLAKKYLPDGMMFVWITPPALWYRKAVFRWIGFGFMGLVFVLVLLQIFLW